MKNRFACINVVDFPLCALLKDLAPRSLYPYAVAENEHPHALLVAVNQIAERDVHVGMTTAQARNRCAQLRILVQDTKQEKYESDKLQELLYCVGPHVETVARTDGHRDRPGSPPRRSTDAVLSQPGPPLSDWAGGEVLSAARNPRNPRNPRNSDNNPLD